MSLKMKHSLLCFIFLFTCIDGYIVIRGLPDMLSAMHDVAPMPSLTFSVPVNIVAIGFNGEGKGGMNLTLSELKNWFSHIQHTVRHTRVPYRDGSPDMGKEAILQESHVFYQHKFNIIKASIAVSNVFKQEIESNMHKDDVTGDTVVNPVVIDELLACFVKFLGVTDQPTIALLNLDIGQKYGYRWGEYDGSLQCSGQNEVEWASKHVSASRTTAWSRDCVVDRWISGSHRIAFADIAAGPYSWGKGDGIKSASAVSRVESNVKTGDHVESLRALRSDFCSKTDGDAEIRHHLCNEMDGRINNAATQHHTTLSQLGAIIDTALKHVITPSSASFRAYFAPRVTFNVYIVGPSSMDVSMFRDILHATATDGQEVQIVVHRLSSLSIPYLSSLITSIIPSIDKQGAFESKKRVSIDSKTLAKQLLNTHMSTVTKVKPGTKIGRLVKHSKRSMSTVKEISIFVFATDHVFIDGYETAVALKHVVIGVEMDKWPSSVTCNGNPIVSTTPISALIRASLLHVSGAIPSHLSHIDGRVVDDWSWSVGPLSHTCSHVSISSLHRDVVHRHWIVNAIDTVAELVSSGVAKLNKAVSVHVGIDHPVTDDALRIFDNITSIRADMERMWSDTVSTSTCHQLLGLARQFNEACNLLVDDALVASMCDIDGDDDDMVIVVSILMLSLVSVTVLWLTRKKEKKIKIN